MSVEYVCWHMLCFVIPLADPSMRMISTATSLDVSLLNVTNAVSELLLSAAKYCDWLNDTTASVRVIPF